jgi:hypothetical protein
MSLIIFALLQLAAPAQLTAGTRIEVDQIENAYRIVVEESRKTKIYPWELESPGSGLPPGNVSVLVMNKNGDIVGCGSDNLPHRAATVSSKSMPVSKIKPLRLKKSQSFSTPWHDVAHLFVFFDECVKPGRRGGYIKYKILMRIEANSGHLRAETEWLDFPGYETSAWNSVVKPPRKP